MEQHDIRCQALHFMMVILAAFNVALNTWLVNRRSKADQREAKRNGNGYAQGGTVAGNVEPSESARSAPR